MLYCLSPECPYPQNPDGNIHCQNCGAPLTLRNRFKALRTLGQGGFGTTYLAQDLDNRAKLCVIKRFSYQSSSARATTKAKQLFEQEAERLDLFQHSQIPRLLAYFQEGIHLYLVQEFVEGQTLQAELAQTGVFDETKIRDVLQGLLPILQFVHSRNVIHRDIKPDNIMRRDTGELVLIDFGVAKLLEQSSLAKTVTTIGTPGYAAPEQTYGRVTPASDLFALGATCFELLTQAFGSGRTEMLGYRWVDRWQQYIKPPLRADLAAVLTKLMQLDERSRYSTATDVLRDLNHAQKSAQQKGEKTEGKETNAPTLTTVLTSPVTSLMASDAANTPNPADTPDPAKKASISPSFWLKYSFFSYVGQALSFALSMVGVAFYAVAFQPSLQNDISAVLSLIRLMYWPVAGVIVGTAQWLALRRWVSGAVGWILAMMAGYGAIALSRILAGDLSIYSSVIVGLFIGGLQWLVLRTQTTRALWWIPWVAMMTTVLFKVLATYSYTHFLGWGIIGPVLDGLFLTWVLQRRKP